jgi:hypothetical protein
MQTERLLHARNKDSGEMLLVAQSSSSGCTTIQRSNVALTFTEFFPIGLVVTLLSAGIFRKKVRDPEN